ncbi:7010_t:CDS:2, partial [Gigaspora rosea]
YISDDYNIFASDDNNNSEDENSQNNSAKEANQKSNLNISSKLLKVSCQVANCNTVLGYNNTPSTMKSHLHNKHQITKASLNKHSANELKKDLPLKDQLTLYQTLETIKPHSKIRIQKLNNSLLRFIINSIQPLSIIEDEDFIKYSYNLDPKDKLPCRQVLKDKIDEVYHDNIQEIQQKINEINYASITLDLWSSAAHVSYLGVTLHWVTNHFIPCEILLAIKEIPYLHTAIIIKDEVEKLITKFQLESKLYAIVTNNGSNLKQIILDGIQYIIAFERLIILKSAIIALKETLLEDINSRTRQEEEILEELIPSIYEWKLIKEVIQLLEPFKQLTKLFSGQYYPILNLIYPCIVLLQNSLSKVSTNINILKESKIQAIDEIKREYENVINNNISNNSVSYQASSSNSALASILQKK